LLNRELKDGEKEKGTERKGSKEEYRRRIGKGDGRNTYNLRWLLFYEECQSLRLSMPNSSSLIGYRS
jgi:hypothetical protein